MADIGSMYATLGVKLQGIQAAQSTMLKMLRTISAEVDRTKAKLAGFGVGVEDMKKKINKTPPPTIVPIVKTDKAMDGLNKMTSHMFLVAQRWRTFGYLTSAVITAPLVMAGKAAIDSAGDFNYAMAKMRGLAGIPLDSIDNLKESLKELAIQTAQTPQALSEAAYFTASAGFKDSAQVMSIVETAAKMATAGMGSAGDNAKVLVFSMNAYRKSGLTAAQAADIFTAAVREGAIETDQFSTAMQQVLPLASSMGVGLDQVAGSMAAMSLQGASAQNSAVYLKGMLNALLKIKPGNAADKALKQFGITADDLYEQLRQPGGLLKVLVRLQELSKQSTGNVFIKDIFRDIRAMTGALSLTGENLEYNAKVMQEVANAGGSMEDAYGAVQGQIEVVKKRLKALSEVMKIEFGETLAKFILPYLEKWIIRLKNLITWFNSTGEGFKKFITIIGGVLTVMGPIALIGSTFKYIWAGSILAIGKQFIWLRNIVKGLNGDLVAMKFAAGAKSGLTNFLNTINTQRINAGGWAMLAKNVGKTLIQFVGKAGPIALVVSGVAAGAIAIAKYAKKTKEAAIESQTFHSTLAIVNDEFKKFKELNKEDMTAMSLEQLMLTRQTALEIKTDTYNRYLQAQKNLEDAPWGTKNQREKQLAEALKNYEEATKIYNTTSVVMGEMQQRLVEEKKAHEKLALEEETAKINEFNEALTEEYQKILGSIKAIDERAKAFKDAGKPYDVIREKAEELIKGIETLTGTEFNLKYNAPMIQDLLLRLRELGYDFTETGEKSREFAEDLNSSLAGIKMKKGLLGNMYDADSAYFDLYKKSLDEYINTITSVDPITGKILAPTQEQIDMLNLLNKNATEYGEIVQDNTDRQTLNLLNAEADAFRNISGKVEVLNYALEAQRRLLRDMFKKQMTGEFIPTEDIQRAVRNIQALEGALIDYQNAESIKYLEDLNKALQTGATGADLITGKISALEAKLQYFSKLGPAGEEMFKITAGQLKGLKMAQEGLNMLNDTFGTVIDNLIDGTEDWDAVWKDVFSNMAKELAKFMVKLILYQAVIKQTGSVTTDLGKIWKLTFGDILSLLGGNKKVDITKSLGFGATPIMDLIKNSGKQGPDLSQYLPPVETLDAIISKYGTLGKVTEQYGAVQNALVGIEQAKTASIVSGTIAERASTTATIAGTVADTAAGAAASVEAGADAAGAVASATKQGAKMPFPLNIIAIAAGVAAVIGAIALIGRAHTSAAKMAEGGVVPQGFPNDTFPALLSSGETVIPKKLNADQFRIEKDDREATVRFEIEGETLVGILKKKEKKSKIY